MNILIFLNVFEQILFYFYKFLKMWTFFEQILENMDKKLKKWEKNY